jgi:hypothetical protein
MLQTVEIGGGKLITVLIDCFLNYFRINLK